MYVCVCVCVCVVFAILNVVDSNRISTYIGLITTTLSRHLKFPFSDTSSIS